MTPYDDDVRDVPQTTKLGDLTRALDRVAEVLAAGSSVPGSGWRCQSVYSHVAHALAHLQVWMAERSVDNLDHALVRAAMALELTLRATADGVRQNEKGD